MFSSASGLLLRGSFSLDDALRMTAGLVQQQPPRLLLAVRLWTPISRRGGAGWIRIARHAQPYPRFQSKLLVQFVVEVVPGPASRALAAAITGRAVADDAGCSPTS